jgi:integrase
MATIRQRKGGWQAAIRRKGHKPIYLTHEKKSVVERWAREKEQAMDEGSYRDTRAASGAFLRDLFDKYLAVVTPTREASSYVPERSRLRTLKRQYGDLTLAQLNVSVIIEKSTERLNKVSSDAVRRELHTLSDVVDSAQILWGLHIVSNPVPNAKRILSKLRKLVSGKKRERRLREGEYELLKNCPHDNVTLINKIILFDIETGMRRGELAEAQREYVDREKRIIHVPRSKSDWKTGKKGRVIPLSILALSIYDSLPIQIDGSLFGMRGDSITQAFERVREKLKITDLRFHDLRHEAISRWFEKGFSIEEVASMSGHSSWESLKRYTHPDPEKLAMRL